MPLDFAAVARDLATVRARWTSQATVITEVRIETVAGICHVWGTAEDTERLVFSYYPDELTFTAAELTGRTVEQIRAQHHDRDVAWLRS